MGPLETYVIHGPRGSGAIGLNGAVAHLSESRGPLVTIMSFTEVEGHRDRPSTGSPRDRPGDGNHIEKPRPWSLSPRSSSSL